MELWKVHGRRTVVCGGKTPLCTDEDVNGALGREATVAGPPFVSRAATVTSSSEVALLMGAYLSAGCPPFILGVSTFVVSAPWKLSSLLCSARPGARGDPDDSLGPALGEHDGSHHPRIQEPASPGRKGSQHYLVEMTLAPVARPPAHV